MRFLAFNDERELDMLAAKDTGIGKAVEMLKYMSKDETLRSLEMSHQKYEWDVASRIAGARKEGIAEGEARGLAEGRSEGLAEGETRGHYEGTLQVARAALAEGSSLDFIERITGLNAEVIKKLQEN